MTKPAPRFVSLRRRSAGGGATRRPWGWLLLALAVSASVAIVAHAQKPRSSLDAIRERMDAGQALFLAGDYEKAARIFEQGFDQFPYSAFLFNAGVCHQKSGDAEQALSSFQEYLREDPNAPDAAAVRERIDQLQRALDEARTDQPGMGGAGGAPEPAPVRVDSDESESMKSLVVIETEPPGAPVVVYRRTSASIPAFRAGASNRGWDLVVRDESPLQLTLDVGKYHVVVEEFRDFNRSETDIDVAPGHVHQFKANLSQGAFMGFLKVSSNVVGAYVYLDDDGRKKVAWGTTPHGELIPPGEHTLVVEAPGYEPSETEVVVEAGDQKEVEVSLVRLGYGVVRLDATVEAIRVRRGDRHLGVWHEGEPALELTLPAGEQQLVISSPGYKDLRTTVDVPRGQILPVRAKMIEKYPRGAAWTQAVLSAGLIGASIYVGIESDRLHSNLQADRAAGNLSNSDPRIDQGFWYSIGANSGFALGGLFAGLSAYNFIKDPYPDSELKRGKKLEFEETPLPPGVTPPPSSLSFEAVPSSTDGPNEASTIFVAGEKRR